MKRYIASLLALLALLTIGCVSTPRKTPPAHPNLNIPEPPLSEIPEYPALDKAYDVSAKVCVYPTIWISQPIADGLSRAGYTILPPLPARNEIRVVNPDFVIEPLTLKHTTEKRKGNLWLFTRIVLQVRTPIRIENGTAQTSPKEPPRIFQVYARRNLGAVAGTTEANYRDNVGAAVENLLRVGAFRDALSAFAQNAK